uniref:Retinitis pigmentosa gtpase regulator n=1 Tax=Rhipicephalus zambeziensis TaxID=60191 RepID=A0A224YZV8_9ACAR
MPPRKNTARRGRPWAKFGDSGDRTAQDEASDGAAVVASTDDSMTKPGGPAKKSATPARKVPAAPKPRPAAAAAIEQPAAKKRAVAATKPAAEKAVRTVSEASEDDGAFEALVLDADDDEEAPAGDEENVVAEDGNEEVAAAGQDENGEEGDAGVTEPLGGDEVAGEGAEGWDEEAAVGDHNEEGGEAEYEEGGDHMEEDEAVDVKAEDGLEGDAARDNALGEDAADGAPEASAEGTEGAEPQANGVAVEVENGGIEDAAAAGEGEGETIVRDLAPSERDFVIAEDEEVKEEPTTEVSRLWDLCPDVELEHAETITTSLHESIRLSVRQFIERLLRDVKETGALPEDAIAQDDKPMFGCSLCNVKMHQPELFDSHVETQRHVKRLRWMYFMGMNKELGNYHCRVCHISVPCKDHLVGHLRSDRHLCLSKSLNVHPKYAEHVLSQYYPEDQVKSLLQPQPQQQQPSATASQPSSTGKGKEQKGADKRPDKGKANAGGGGQQAKREQSPPASASHQGFIFHCELCQVIAYHEDQIQEHYKGKKHRAKMAEELEKMSKEKPDGTKKGSTKGDGAQAAKTVSKDAPKGPGKGPGPKKGPVNKPQPQQFKPKGPKFGSGPAPTYTCYVCNVVMHSTREYSQHFTTREHRMAAGIQASAPPLGHKRPRSPSPFSRAPAWSSPPRMRSPPRDLWLGGPPPRKRSPEPFLDPLARDLFAPSSGPSGAFEPGLRGPQPGMLEDYAERRGPGNSSGGMPDPTSVAATLETMIHLQQRLLNITGPQQGSGGGAMMGASSGYRDEEEYGNIARSLQDMDLQKSLQQLRQSQRYNVGPSPPPYESGSTPTSGAYMDSSPFRESRSSFQGGMGDGFGGKRASYGGADSYSPIGDDMKGSYGMGGGSSFGGGGPGGSGGLRTNEYRKSSLGPTAPRPSDFGRPPMGHMRGSGVGSKRY